MSKEIEFYKREFPKTFYDFVSLARPFTHEEIQLCDKEGLIELCVELKRRELQWDIKYHELLNKLEEYIIEDRKHVAELAIYKYSEHHQDGSLTPYVDKESIINAPMIEFK